MSFTSKEFGPDKQFRNIEEYLEALKTIEKAHILRRKFLAQSGGLIPEEEMSIDGEFNANRVVAELKVQNDRNDDRMNDLDRRMELLESKLVSIIEAIQRISSEKKIINKISLKRLRIY